MVYILLALAALSRLLPHPPNFTPIAAMALFGAAALPRRGPALVFPLVALFVSDIVLGFYSPALMASVYGATLLVGVLGLLLARKSRSSAVRIVGAGLTGSVLFFALTNGVCWWTGYPHTAGGLAACYTLALPFFRNEAAGTLVYSVLLFGGLALTERLHGATRGRRTAGAG